MALTISSFAKLKDLGFGRLKLGIQLREVERTARHRLGPNQCNSDGVIAFALAQNAEMWLATFLDHHFSLGVTHVVLLDNDSEDRTLEIAKRYPSVSVYSCSLPFRTHQHAMRLWIQDKFARGRWALMLDVDELFDYPLSHRISVNQLARYLDVQGYTAVFSTMLDMYPSEFPVTGDRLDLNQIAYCEVASIRKGQYKTFGNEVAPGIVHGANGGVRGRLFGPSDIQLVKHPLRKDCGQLWYPLNSHFIYGARLADFSTIIRHYKFVPRFEEMVRERSASGRYWRASQEYTKMVEVIDANSGISMLCDDSFLYSGAEHLLDIGYLKVSPRFRSFLGAHCEPGTC